MGCAETKIIGSEERSVLAAEQGLGFHEQNATRVDSIIRKYSSNGVINHTHLLRIADVLGLNVSNFSPHTKIDDFFRKLLNSDGFYPLKDLLVIGILLSAGTADEKSRLIYQIYDENLTNSLPVASVQNLILKDLAHHSSQSLPLLVTNDQTPFSNTLKNEKYMSDLASISAAATTKVFSNFMSLTFVNEQKFTETFSRISEGALTTSTGWRGYLVETLVSNPPRRNFSNPYKKSPERVEGH